MTADEIAAKRTLCRVVCERTANDDGACLDGVKQLADALLAALDEIEARSALLTEFAPLADRMILESGAWEECPFCDSAPPRGPKPYDWHAATCILHRFRSVATGRPIVTRKDQLLSIVRRSLAKAHRSRDDGGGWTLSWKIHDAEVEALAKVIAEEIAAEDVE